MNRTWKSPMGNERSDCDLKCLNNIVVDQTSVPVSVRATFTATKSLQNRTAHSAFGVSGNQSERIEDIAVAQDTFCSEPI